MTTSTDALDELLAQAGVDLGRPERRRERAVRLTNEGMSEADLNELVDWAHATRRKVHTVGHWLGWVTSNKERWTAMLADTRKVKAKHAATEGTTNAPARPKQVDEREAAARTRGMAWCRVFGDNAPRERVAMELGISTQQLEELLNEERALRGLPRDNVRTPEPPTAAPSRPRLHLVKNEQPPVEPAEEESW